MSDEDDEHDEDEDDDDNNNNDDISCTIITIVNKHCAIIMSSHS